MEFPAANFLSFNVSGNKFTTTRETILREPASRLALIARGVLAVNRDDSGAFFLDRDAKYFQLVLNYLRDGWCSLPKSQEERRELLQEIRYYQLAGMEAWMRTQDVVGEAALRPPSPNPYNRYTSTPGTPTTTPAYCNNAETCPNSCVKTTSSCSSPLYNSFIHGSNQDLLTASLNTRASYSPTVPHNTAEGNSLRWLEQQAGAPELAMIASSSTGLQRSPSPAAYRPASAGCSSPVYGGCSCPVGCSGCTSSDSRQACHCNTVSFPSRITAISTCTDPSMMACRSPTAPLYGSDFKWTSRYLQSNSKMQEVVSTLLELAFMAPHPSLQGGKSTVSICSECDHDTFSNMLVTAATGVDSGRFRYQVIRVQNSLGWSFELSLRPSSDLAVYDKYNVAQYIQDNMFVLTAILKDQYGVVMVEDDATRPKCMACRRNNIALVLHKSCYV